MGGYVIKQKTEEGAGWRIKKRLACRALAERVGKSRQPARSFSIRTDRGHGFLGRCSEGSRAKDLRPATVKTLTAPCGACFGTAKIPSWQSTAKAWPWPCSAVRMTVNLGMPLFRTIGRGMRSLPCAAVRGLCKRATKMASAPLNAGHGNTGQGRLMPDSTVPATACWAGTKPFGVW